MGKVGKAVIEDYINIQNLSWSLGELYLSEGEHDSLMSLLLVSGEFMIVLVWWILEIDRHFNSGLIIFTIYVVELQNQNQGVHDSLNCILRLKWEFHNLVRSRCSSRNHCAVQIDIEKRNNV